MLIRILGYVIFTQLVVLQIFSIVVGIHGSPLVGVIGYLVSLFLIKGLFCHKRTFCSIKA